jgi:hypothetical protein
MVDEYDNKILIPLLLRVSKIFTLERTTQVFEVVLIVDGGEPFLVLMLSQKN